MSIVLERLVKRFAGQSVVSRVSLEIEDGELFVLLGASGSGKSTVLRLIAGLTAPDEGRIHLRGRDVTDLPPQERGIGFVFQNYSIFRHMSVAENIEFPLKIRKTPRGERIRRREELLDLVGLGGLGGRYGDQLSGGQQQRVALARALAHEPSVLLLDEPFGALDVKIRGQLRRNLLEIQRTLGVTAILVTHDQEEAFELADRVGLMERGALLEVGEPERLYARPRSLFGATFLGAGTVLVGRARGGEAHLGDLALPIPREVEHEENARVRVLIRPEQVELSAEHPAPEPAVLAVLGRGMVVERSFLGALRRVRVRLPPIAGVRQAAPDPFGEEGLLIDAVLPADAETPGPEVWVGLRGWHILGPPRPRLLVSVPEAAALPAALPRLVEAVDGVPTLLTVAGGGDAPEAAEALRAALAEHGREEGHDALDAAEVLVRRGDPAAEIAAEQAQGVYDFVVLCGGAEPVFHGLLDHLGTALLLLRGAWRETAPRFLICTAVGEPGKADVRVGGWLARRLDATVTLLHVNVGGGGGGPGGRNPEAWVQSHLNRGLATLRALEVKSEGKIRNARTPAEGILAEATEGGYDLLVMGRHAPRHSPLFRPKAADITLRILAGTETSVLIVPAEE